MKIATNKHSKSTNYTTTMEKLAKGAQTTTTSSLIVHEDDEQDIVSGIGCDGEDLLPNLLPQYQQKIVPNSTLCEQLIIGDIERNSTIETAINNHLHVNNDKAAPSTATETATNDHSTQSGLNNSNNNLNNTNINNNNNNHTNNNNNGSSPSTSSPTKSPSKISTGVEPANLAGGLPVSLQGLPMASELYELFSTFRRYKGSLSGKRDEELQKFQTQVNSLFQKDYEISIINNRNGELCATYPPELIVLEREKDITCECCKDKNLTQVNNSQSIQKLLSQSRFARVRTRCPFPVILYHNKNLCRSSTLSKKIEYMFQSGVNTMKKQFSNTTALNASNNSMINGQPSSSSDDESDKNGDLQNMENLRNSDICAIKHLSVKYICDLMVENKKKKFGFYVCSSEKADMHDRYTKQFVITSTPYPGVEFFAEFHQNSHNAKDLFFSWDITEYPAELRVENNSIAVNWEQYKTWDLLYLTQNYFKLLLEYTADDSKDSGLLVHCISGWDRTPLFISLLRISLWADGEIHQNLNSAEIVFLSVAYDWFLFSHQLSDRAGRNEDIFYFCFYFLEYITSMEYSIHTFTNTTNQNNNNNNNNNNNVPLNVNNDNINNQQQQQDKTNQKSNNVNNNRTSKISDHRLKNQSGNNSSSSMGSTPSTTTTSSSPLNSDISQSAPSTPKSNSPTSIIKLPAFIYNYTTYGSNSTQPTQQPQPLLHQSLQQHNNNTNNNHSSNGKSIHHHHHSFQSAPTTPLSHSPLPKSALVDRCSPNLSSSTIPVDVPTKNSSYKGYSISSNNSFKMDGSLGANGEELGGSWQIMGSIPEKMKSLSSFGSTPKFPPTNNSFSSSTSHSESTMDKNVTSDDDDEDCKADDLDTTWDPSTSFIPGELDSTINSNDSYLNIIDSTKKSINNQNGSINGQSNLHQLLQQHQQQEQKQKNENNNSDSSKKHKHSQLSMKELEERRKQRLMEVKSLFVAIYQQSCVSSNDSYWKTFWTYLPKFG